METFIFEQCKYFIRVILYLIIIKYNITVTFLFVRPDEFWKATFTLLIGVIIKSPIPGSNKNNLLPVTELDVVDGPTSR